MSLTLEQKTPQRLGSRGQARELLQILAADFSQAVVVLDCSDLVVSTPSFVDELILLLLVEGNARQLVLKGAPERTQRYAIRSADLRSVSERLGIV